MERKLEEVSQALSHHLSHSHHTTVIKIETVVRERDAVRMPGER